VSALKLTLADLNRALVNINLETQFTQRTDEIEAKIATRLERRGEDASVSVEPTGTQSVALVIDIENQASGEIDAIVEQSIEENIQI